MIRKPAFKGVESFANVKYFSVVDLEATCSEDNTITRSDMETIEIGAVIVDAVNFKKVDEFQSFIRPLRNPHLTKFCIGLTNIKQTQVDSAKTFPDVMDAFQSWLFQRDHTLFCSWGIYDKIQLERDSKRHNIDLGFLNSHLNVKDYFIALDNLTYRPTLREGLNLIGSKFVGEEHRALTDATNTVKLLKYCIERSLQIQF